LDFFWKGNYAWTHSAEDFNIHIGSKICYANEKPDGNSYWICPIGLLSETHIQTQNFQISYWNELPVFFQAKGDLGFDIFAASFYLLARYEEYLPHEKDKYGRYAETNSLAFKEKFLRLPLIDLWRQQLENILQVKFPDYQPEKRTFQYTPTFDIDMPFAFLHKPFYVHIGAFAKNILHGNKNVLQQQIATWLGKMQDPFDSFSLLNVQMRQYDFQPIFFFPVAKRYGQFDKNPPQSNITFQQLIQQQSRLFDIGLHPSWQSGDCNIILTQEKTYLEKTSGKKITKSRQHYIRMTLPETYQNLINTGIEEDFSMGYGNIDGFRASTSRTFYWFDLSKNEATQLSVHPFCWMDATAYHHTKESPEQVFSNLQYYYEIIQSVGGHMITIMHNNYFAPTSDMAAFREAMLSFWKKLIR